MWALIWGQDTDSGTKRPDTFLFCQMPPQVTIADAGDNFAPRPHEKAHLIEWHVCQ